MRQIAGMSYTAQIMTQEFVVVKEKLVISGLQVETWFKSMRCSTGMRKEYQ
jgi:hypothetical protein